MAGMLTSVVHNPGSQSTVTGTQQQENNPVHTKLDATNLVVNFTTNESGYILVVLSVEVEASASTADNFLEWSLLDGSDTVIIPTAPSDNGGRRVSLQQSATHRAKLDLLYQLSPNTAYTLYWGYANGAQGDAVITTTYSMEWGGTKGPAVMEIWELGSVGGASGDSVLMEDLSAILMEDTSELQMEES